ncbi:hypothetical protein WG947_09310 [Pontibacter sp. H259]|uniref:hypothetical protein n=1 Tax=Pontibacter sp. H259 TaxID=3133421 RepID=UPI0030BD99D9
MLSITIVASAQKGRYLQTINLGDKENTPFFATTHSLPGYILDGIKSEEITPYRVDYATKKAEPFTATEKESLLYQINASVEEWDHLSPRMLNNLDVDVTLKKGKATKIHYLNFHTVHFTDDATRLRGDRFKDYYFSVSFEQVAAYLEKQNALWVKNAGPLLWKNNMVHTYGQDAFSVVSSIVPQLEEHAMELHVALSLDEKGKIDKVGAYSWQHELVQEVTLPDSLYVEGEVLSMPEALVAGRYRASEQMALKTKLPEFKFTFERKLKQTSYVIMQTEKLYLDHPGNKVFLQPEQELSALLVEAASKGTVNKVYATDSLHAILSEATWNERLKVKEYDMFGDGYTLSEDNYLPQQLSVLHVTWKWEVDVAGNMISKTPYALGLYLHANSSPANIETLIGYLSYQELYQSAKASNGNKQLLTLLENLAGHNYTGYLSHTSEMIENTN